MPKFYYAETIPQGKLVTAGTSKKEVSLAVALLDPTQSRAVKGVAIKERTSSFSDILALLDILISDKHDGEGDKYNIPAKEFFKFGSTRSPRS